MSEWRTIDSAPKDGREILGIFVPTGPYDPDYAIIEWDGKNWIAKADGWRAIEAQGDTFTDYITPFCTHWMPLPEPPKD